MTSRPPAGAHRAPGGAWRDAVDRVAGSDPGLLRLRNALKAVLSIGLALAAEYVFVRLTHALELTAGTPAVLAAQHHGVTVIAELLGAMVGMLSAFAVSDPQPRDRLITMLLLPVPMVATLALGLALGGHRLTSLILFVAMLTIGTYFRRFGPRGFLSGMLLFLGAFLGFFLHAEIAFSQIGWLIAELGVGLVVAIAVSFGLFYPRPHKDLARLQRSWLARARRLFAITEELVADYDPALERRLNRQLVRLNEATLMIDAVIGDASAVPSGSTASELHQRLFDLELAMSNVTRLSAALAKRPLADGRRRAVIDLLGALSQGRVATAEHSANLLLSHCRHPAVTPSTGELDIELVLLHRLGNTTLDLVRARAEWLGLGAGADIYPEEFTPAVALVAGYLPGSALVSAQASTSDRERLPLAPYIRTAIQMGVAVSLAIAIGDVLSPRRFYWAVIAAFVSFMAANNSAEQARKAVLRVAGTVGGIFLGGLLAHAVGTHTNWAITVILAALFVGFYLMRISYAFFVIGITVMVSQLYVQLDEYANTLLVTRLEETAIGAGCAILTVLVVFPLRARRVLAVAVAAHVRAVGEVVDATTSAMLGERSPGELRGPLRDVDASWQALVSVARPLRRTSFSALSIFVETVMATASSSRNYARNLLADLDSWPGVEDRELLARAGATLRSSVDGLVAGIEGDGGARYVRASALLEEVSRPLAQTGRSRLAIRDLQLIDGALAALAKELSLDVLDYDTTEALVGAGL